MRRVILQMGVSLDGFVARVDGKHEWGYHGEDEAHRRWKLDALHSAGAHLMGRVTYEEMVTVWPTSTSEIAAPMNAIPKVVFSRTLETADWPDTTIARGDLADEIAEIKRQPGADVIAHGGATFAGALCRLGLVDEYRLLVHPAALGTGLALFSRLQSPLFVELAESHSYNTGAVLNIYRPRPGSSDGNAVW
jgi:dihydrofolate reductase